MLKIKSKLVRPPKMKITLNRIKKEIREISTKA